MGNYKIVKMQLPIVGGIAGHNFIVMLNDKNQVIGELHGLATKNECNEVGEPIVKPIGYLPSDRLKFHKIDGEYFYNENYPQQTVFEGTEAEVRAKWEMAIGSGWAINRKDLRYPILGVIDVFESPFNGPENSNSVASILLKTMGLDDPHLEWRLTPGEKKQLLTEDELKAIRDNPLKNQYNPVCEPQQKTLSQSNQGANQDFIFQGFADLLSDNPQQGISKMLNSDYAKAFDVQAQQVLAQDEAQKQQEQAEVQALSRPKMMRS